MNHSPLRYPGSKNKFYPIIQSHLNGQKQYAEAYAGGSSVALKLLFNKNIQTIHMNDLDRGVYGFWYSVIHHTHTLIQKIVNTPINIEIWYQQKEILTSSQDLFLLGFATFFLNRTNFSGVIKGGVMGGLKQEGNYKIDCRFNKPKLINKIQKIARFKNNIKIYHSDALDFLTKIDHEEKNIFLYIDPPYYKKGKELYLNYYQDKDHTALRKVLSKIKNKWLLSYDSCTFIKNLYQENFQINHQSLTYSAGLQRIGKELLIQKFPNVALL